MEKHFFLLSTVASGKNGLATLFQVLKLFVVGRGAQPLDLGFPLAPDNMLVVHGGKSAVPRLFAGMGTKRNKMIARRSKCVRGCRLILQSLPNKELSYVLKVYKGCPYFASMLDYEYDGSAFEACPIVIRLYPKTSYHRAISAFVLYHIYNVQ